MVSLFKPSPRNVSAFLARQASAPFSYQAVGCTFADPPTGFAVDHERQFLGEGPRAFEAAAAALRSWTMVDVGWVQAADPACPIEVGRDVGVIARLGFAWIMAGCRIVNVVDEPGMRFGFSYGTLLDHPESGEERFLIEQEGNGVYYDILAISRPARWYVRIGYPIARRLQRRFRLDSVAAMRRALRKV